MQLILHNLRSRYNVGSIFRTADAAGVEKIFVCGTTPAPLDRFGRIDQKIAKVALGAEQRVTWQQCAQTGRLIQTLQRQGLRILALEQHPGSTSLFSTRVSRSGWNTTALLVGPEVNGLTSALLNRADQIIEIPMFGSKESLNVAVATGIALYQLRSASGLRAVRRQSRSQ